MVQRRRTGSLYAIDAICALFVEFHVQPLGYIRSRAYLYVFDVGPTNTVFLSGSSLPPKSQQSFLSRTFPHVAADETDSNTFAPMSCGLPNAFCNEDL